MTPRSDRVNATTALTIHAAILRWTRYAFTVQNKVARTAKDLIRCLAEVLGGRHLVSTQSPGEVITIPLTSLSVAPVNIVAVHVYIGESFEFGRRSSYDPRSDVSILHDIMMMPSPLPGLPWKHRRQLAIAPERHRRTHSQC